MFNTQSYEGYSLSGNVFCSSLNGFLMLMLISGFEGPGQPQLLRQEGARVLRRSPRKPAPVNNTTTQLEGLAKHLQEVTSRQGTRKCSNKVFNVVFHFDMSFFVLK